MQEVKKIIIPISDLGTNFLSLSKVIPMELWPLADKSIVEYLLQEVKDSEIENCIFVVSDEKKIILNYLKHDPKLKKLLKDQGDENGLKALEGLEELIDNINFTSIKQTKQLGNGYAVLQALSKISKDEPFAVMTSNNIVDSRVPCLQQLIDIYNTSQKPVIALKHVSSEEAHLHTLVQVDKIANKVFKIKKIIKDTDKDISDLAIVGKYILTPEVFDFLKINNREEITLANTFADMIQAGKTIYGYEFEGTHLEIKDKDSYLKTNMYLLNKSL